MAEYGGQQIQYNAKTKSGIAEMHAHWADTFIVTGGEASILLGGTIPNARSESEGEMRGVAIVGGREHKLSKGDIVHVAANTPHQFILAPGQSITFLNVKVAQP
jgi:mannose-6-phosphate isomerase-like protein (cupin superfamily)